MFDASIAQGFANTTQGHTLLIVEGKGCVLCRDSDAQLLPKQAVL